MFECFRCGCKSLVWQNDYDTEDFGYEGEGIVSLLTCSNEKCRSEVQVTTFFENDEE